MIYPTFDKTYAEVLEKDFGTAGYRAAENGVTAEFAQALADEYASDLPAAAQNIIFQQAWSEGHASDLAPVENCYINLAEFATSLRNVL